MDEIQIDEYIKYFRNAKTHFEFVVRNLVRKKRWHVSTVFKDVLLYLKIQDPYLFDDIEYLYAKLNWVNPVYDTLDLRFKISMVMGILDELHALVRNDDVIFTSDLQNNAYTRYLLPAGKDKVF
jgi:hypothetical protein